MPVAQSDIAAATQTAITGNRSHMNSTTTAAMMMKTIQISLTGSNLTVLREGQCQ
jgi:hypothetical protein